MGRRSRFGRNLKTVPAAPFLTNLPPEFAAVVDGFKLAQTTRPYLTQGGSVRVRLVFRKRNPDLTYVVNWTLCGAVDDALLDTLNAALGAGLRVRARV